MKEVDVKKRILAANEEAAGSLRSRFGKPMAQQELRRPKADFATGSSQITGPN